jgi:hypothetical protein
MPAQLGSLPHARQVVDSYNEEHYHVGLALLHPIDVHYGRTDDIVAARSCRLAGIDPLAYLRDVLLARQAGDLRANHPAHRSNERRLVSVRARARARRSSSKPATSSHGATPASPPTEQPPPMSPEPSPR